MTEAVISASYEDFKFVKTRSVCQIILEIPIENGNDFINKFGVPIPAETKHVAVALLTGDNPQQQIEDTAKNAKAVQIAGILCKDATFRNYLNEMHMLDPKLSNEEETAEYLRSTLGIKSRRELESDANARDELFYISSNFNSWKERNGKG